MRWRATLALIAIALAANAGDRDPKAARLQAQGIQLAKQADGDYRRFILDRAAFLDAEVDALIDAYEDAAELLHQSLEIEEFDGINGQIIVIARRLAKLRFEQIRRKAKKALPQKPETRPSEETKPEAKPKPKPVEPKPAKPKPKPKPPTENDRDETDVTRRQPWPELIEDAKEKRRGLQSLRSFLMHYYFANRKFSTLIDRCTRCNGTASIKLGRDGRGKIVFGKCPRCHATGGHLNLTAARKAYWLIMSPLHRADPARRAQFDEKLATWEQDPRKIGEFMKSLSISSIDYHGLWAVVKYKEKSTLLKNNMQIPFRRVTTCMLIRLGKRWFVYDESTDKEFFNPDAE